MVKGQASGQRRIGKPCRHTWPTVAFAGPKAHEVLIWEPWDPHDSSRDTPVTCAPAKHSLMSRPAVGTPQTHLTVTQTFFYFVVSPQSLPVLSPENAPVRLLPSWLEALWQPSNKFSPIALMHSSPPVLAPNQAKPSRA